MKQPSPNKHRVLVVGTTPDYIDWIRNAWPDRALFITEPALRQKADEPVPHAEEEICCSLDRFETVRNALSAHLDQWELTLSGIACFDCEALELAARLAAEWGLPYPGRLAIRNSRDKLVSKQIWQQNGIRCPDTMPVTSQVDLLDFLDSHPAGLVLKPVSGSGSELVFRCSSREDCIQAFEAISEGLTKRAGNRLFNQAPRHGFAMVAEEWVDGTEYSCDFLIRDRTAAIIRMTRKIKPAGRPFGTVSGYMLTDLPLGRFDRPAWEDVLFRAAGALGIRRGICMADIIVRDGEPIIIEMTPRPGGDCLPHLMRAAGDLDMLGLTLDVAEQKPVSLKPGIDFPPMAGLRIHAGKAGVLKGIRTENLAGDSRIKSLHFFRRPGHTIVMPPEDYDSWLLGHMIVDLGNPDFSETRCLLMTKRVEVDIQ